MEEQLVTDTLHSFVLLRALQQHADEEGFLDEPTPEQEMEWANEYIAADMPLSEEEMELLLTICEESNLDGNLIATIQFAAERGCSMAWILHIARTAVQNGLYAVCPCCATSAAA